MSSKRDEVHIWIDGSCNNRKQELGGGVGVVMKYGSYLCKIAKGPYIPATSARMEVMALLVALESLTRVPYKVCIYSDNEYVVNTMNEWMARWKTEHIIKRKANGDLWVKIRRIDRAREIAPYVEWVKGHNSDEYNEMADKLANKGRLGDEQYEVVKLSE